MMTAAPELSGLQPLDRALLTLLQHAAREAILPHYQTLAAHEVDEKASTTPAIDDVVTIADHKSEALLAEGLARIMPGVPIVGEEAAHADPAVLARLSGDCWIIDPLDGTRNFAKGQPPFGILIAVASGGIARSGWIFDVLSGRFCHAHAGKGAFLNGQPLSARATGEAMPVAAISMLFMDQQKRAAMMRHIAPHYRLVDIPYCAAEQYPRLGLGQNDVSIFERTLAWDHAAGVLWLNEAGGQAARPDGSAYRVDGDPYGGLLGAASPSLWEGLAQRLEYTD